MNATHWRTLDGNHPMQNAKRRTNAHGDTQNTADAPGKRHQGKAIVLRGSLR